MTRTIFLSVMAALLCMATAQTAFFSDMARECEGVFREGLPFVLKTDMLKEASGIAISRKHPNVVWSHNDGMPQQLVGISTNPGQEGLPVATLSLPDYIKPASGDGDWEDFSGRNQKEMADLARVDAVSMCERRGRLNGRGMTITRKIEMTMGTTRDSVSS